MNAMAHHPVIQDFLDWHKNAQIPESCDNGLEIKRSFVPDPLLWSYFESSRKVQKILEALFSSHEELPVDPVVVWKYYLKVFCILLLANKGKFIQLFTPHNNLGDRYLPFESCPPHFPIASANNCRFFESFYEQQWRFCAPQLEYDIGKRFEAKDWVLPITQKVKQRDGASASIYKITIHPAYNKLRHTLDPNDPDVNTFILKTYRTKDAEKYYLSEVDAFRKIKSAKKHHRSIIGFYGSFVRDGTYNVLLEYANTGTLEGYFHTTAPPQSGKDILKFWQELFAVIYALNIIHNVQPSGYDGEHSVHGWHQDVKPDNILVSSTHPESLYDCHFKLADLGNSHFRRIKGVKNGVTDKDTYGTRAYGAPECYRSNGSIGRGQLQITQKVDIWSAGCVLSEAAIWVSRGMRGLLEYRRRRKQETSEIPEFQDGDCFHDGERALRVVQEMHEFLPDFIRGGDHITQAVSDMALEMLVTSDRRPDASSLVRRAERIVTEADNKLIQRRSLIGGAQPMNDFLNSPHIRKPPPELPPSVSQTNYYVPSQFKTERPVYDGPGNHLINKHTHYRNHIDPSRQSRYYDLVNNSEIDPFEEHKDQGPSHDRQSDSPRNQKFSAPHHSTPTIYQEEMWNSTQIRDREFVNSRWENNSRTTTRASPQRINPNLRESRRIQLDNPHAQHPQNGNHEFTKETYPDSKTSLETMSRRSVASPSTLPIKPCGQYSHLKNLSMADALNWKKVKKQGVKDPLLPDAHLLDQLNKRDHVFIIDDSSSMNDHWSTVKDVFGLLAYMVKGADPDGIELYFTNSSKKKKSRTTTDLMLMVSEKSPEGHSNLNQCLGPILQGYRLRLQEHQAKLQEYQAELEHPRPLISKFKKARSPTAPRPLNIYILTDGIWQEQCDPSPMISSTAHCLDKNHYFKQQVGIQFIRFGNDPEGKRRLEHLDSGLNLPMDIVDTEASDGNVWKILLGGMDPQWDDDDDDGNRCYSTSDG